MVRQGVMVWAGVGHSVCVCQCVSVCVSVCDLHHLSDGEADVAVHHVTTVTTQGHQAT